MEKAESKPNKLYMCERAEDHIIGDPGRESQLETRSFPLPDLSVYVMDADLTEEETARYCIGRDFVSGRAFFASSHAGGITATHRFTILSCRMDGERELFGAVRFPESQRFKVLDVWQYEGHTQILLLHVPREWALIGSFELDDPETLIRRWRSIFRSVVAMLPVPGTTFGDFLGRENYPAPGD